MLSQALPLEDRCQLLPSAPHDCREATPPLRVGDGRSSSSGSHYSTDDTSSIVAATDVSSVTTQDEVDEVTPLTFAGGEVLGSERPGGMKTSDGGGGGCGWEWGMGPREEPDGCSISSGSTDVLVVTAKIPD